MQRYVMLPYVQKLIEMCPVPIRPEGPWLAGGSVRYAYWEDDLITKSDLDVWLPHSMKDIRRTGDNIVRPDLWNYSNNRYLYYYDKDTRRETQLVDHRSWDNIEQVINSFDFTVCQFATDGEYVYVGDTTLEDTRDRVLRIPDTAAFLSEITFSRIKKYENKGFTALPETLAKLEDLKKKGTLPKCGFYDNTRPTISVLPDPVVPLTSLVEADRQWLRKDSGDIKQIHQLQQVEIGE